MGSGYKIEYFNKLHRLLTSSCILNMAKKSVTSLELRKLFVKLRNEDKLSIGDMSKTLGKSKSVIHSIFRKLKENGSCEAKKLPVSIGKLLKGKAD